MKEDACTTDGAWQVYDTLLLDHLFVYRDEPAGVQAKLKEFTTRFPFSPKLWQDAYLAAFAVEAALELVTFDQGFEKFPGLQAEILRATPGANP